MSSPLHVVLVFIPSLLISEVCLGKLEGMSRAKSKNFCKVHVAANFGLDLTNAKKETSDVLLMSGLSDLDVIQSSPFALPHAIQYSRVTLLTLEIVANLLHVHVALSKLRKSTSAVRLLRRKQRLL